MGPAPCTGRNRHLGLCRIQQRARRWASGRPRQRRSHGRCVALVRWSHGALRDRRLDDTSVPFVYLDATYLHVRADHHVVSKVVVIATGVSSKGMREVGFDVGDSEDEVL
jgi:hypothetical protein